VTRVAKAEAMADFRSGRAALGVSASLGTCRGEQALDLGILAALGPLLGEAALARELRRREHVDHEGAQ